MELPAEALRGRGVLRDDTLLEMSLPTFLLTKYVVLFKGNIIGIHVAIFLAWQSI
jgi:hypothetical protein